MRTCFYTLLTALLFLCCLSPAQAQQTLKWFNTYGSNGDDQGNDIITDGAGNSYVAGYFSGQMQMGAYTLTSKGDKDGFIAKLDSTGAVKWATSFGGKYADGIAEINFAKDGNVLVTGSFFDTATFGSFQLLSKGYLDLCVGKVDAQTGDFLWVNNAGGKYNYVQGNTVCDDGQGNVLVGGNTFGKCFFGTDSVISKGQLDFFIVKYSAGGAFTWVKLFGGKAIDDITSLSVDGNNNIYFAGVFGDTLQLGSTRLVSKGLLDFYWGKLDANANPIWAKGAGAAGSENVQSIKALPDGSFYLGGWTNDTMMLEGQRLDDNGNGNLFLARFTTNGTMRWVRFGYNKNATDLVRDMAVDYAGNAYITGLSNFFVFRLADEGLRKEESASAAACPFGDLIVGKYDTVGNFIFLEHTLGNNYNIGEGVSIDNLGNCYITGYFTDSISFGSTQRTGYAGSDVMVFKLKDNSFITNTSTVAEDYFTTTLYPNPLTDKGAVLVRTLLAEELQVSLTDISGKVLKQYSPVTVQAGTNLLPFAVSVPPGIYFLHIKGQRHAATLKFIVQTF